MMMLGKSRTIAAVVAIACGLSVAPAAAQAPADSPLAPKPVTTAKPAAAGSAAPGAQTPTAKPATPAAAPGTTAKPPAPAKASDAKALFSSGEKKFKADDFEGALADFEAANAAKPTPETQRYVAVCHDKLAHHEQAVAAYEKFIQDAPPKMSAQADEAKARVDAIKKMPGKVHVTSTPPGATVVIDAPPDDAAKGTAAPSPTPTDLELAPGKHTLMLRAEGFEPQTRDVDVAYASKQDLNVELTKTPEPPPPPPPPVVAEKPAPPPPPPPPEPRSKVPAYVTGAVALVAAGVGTGFGIKALQQSSDFEKNPTTKKADDGENNALIADMMFGIAITFGVTSAVLFLSSDAPASAKAQPSKVATAKKKKLTVMPTPYVTSSGGGAGALFRF